MPAIDDMKALEHLEADIRALRDALVAAETARSAEITAAHPSHRRSAANLIHYLELRRHDVRKLQTRLADLGLSSLGRSEPHVLATVEAVLSVLTRLTTHPAVEPRATVALGEGNELLSANSDRLLGPSPAKRATRIMVTLPSEVADNPQSVEQMVVQGMDIARVNCAHDDAQVWRRMIDIVRSTAKADGQPCLVAMDLAGPKLRTGPLQRGPRAVRLAPSRDQVGRVVSPALAWLTATDDHASVDVRHKVIEIPLDASGWVERRRRGDRLELRDGRGAKRRWEVIEAGPGGCLVSTEQTTYVTTGIKLTCNRGLDEDAVAVGQLPELEQAHRVESGDRVVLTRSLDPSIPTTAGDTHAIGCTLPEVFVHARPGERVWLDDGKIGGVIDSVTADEIELTVTDVRPGGANLKEGKGINLPDTDLQLDALTSKDHDDLDFVARHADFVNMSFVRRPDDVERLQAALHRLDADDVGIVMKIENVAAFENLPELLLTAMRHEKVGVMIARGDLAVEVGFERLAEVQEEIMWACEAAHVPVIWATQVLDTLARTGQPSRAEVTDAAMSDRAECVMLNKGPHITEAIAALNSILTRMQHHQHKKRSLLRRLRAWDHDRR
ncbi:MAG: pyruvate kinase [Ilumatobacteraceae bacterium]